jgi:uncharacterized low-complexity protein
MASNAKRQHTEAKTSQTSVQFNSSSTGGTIESFPDAEDQAKEAKSQEGRCEGNQAGAEAKAAERKDGQCRCSEREIRAVVTIGGRHAAAGRQHARPLDSDDGSLRTSSSNAA